MAALIVNSVGVHSAVAVESVPRTAMLLLESPELQ